MGKDKLEHSIKNKLSSYESAVNTDKLWAGIQAGMGAASTPAAQSAVAKGLSSKLLIGIGLLTITAFGLGVFWYSSQNQEAINTSETLELSAVNQQDSQENTKVETKQLTLENNTQVEAKANNSTQATIAKPITSTTPLVNTKTKVSTLNTTNQEKARNQEKATKPTKAIAHVSTTNTFDQQSKSTSANNEKALGLTQKKTETPNVHFETKHSQEVIPSSVSNNQTTTETQVSAVASNIAEMPSYEQVDHSFLALSQNLLEEKGISAKGLNLKKVKNDFVFGKLPKKNIECPSFGGSNNSGGVFMAELQAIPYYSTPRITAKNDQGEIWKQNKLNTESYLETFQVNLLGRYQMNNGLYFNAGVGYGQLDEKFVYNASDQFTTIEGDVPVIIIVKTDGTRDTIVGEGTITIDSTINANIYNYHRMVELTAAVGYEFAVNSRLSVYGDVGLSINILTTRKGRHLLEDFDVVKFDNSARQVFKTSTGYKLTGGVGLRYYAGSGVVLSGGPEFRSHLSNWMTNEQSIELKYFDIGLRMAVGYMF